MILENIREVVSGPPLGASLALRMLGRHSLHDVAKKIGAISLPSAINIRDDFRQRSISLTYFMVTAQLCLLIGQLKIRFTMLNLLVTSLFAQVKCIIEY